MQTETLDSLNNELVDSLESFARYMNRPLARVHALTWHLATVLEPDLIQHKCGTIRYLPAYRDETVKAWRNQVARYVKMVRQFRANDWPCRDRRIKLPLYDEASARYQFSN